MRGKIKILVFPCGSEIGLEINRSLKYDKYIDLYGASSVKSNHGKYVFENYIEIPHINTPDFLKKLNKAIDKYKIDFIFPALDDVVVYLAKNSQKIHCKIIGSLEKTCRICRSKKLTYSLFKNKIPVPRVYNLNDKNIKFPVFLKPEKGQGSIGTHEAKNRTDIEYYLKKDPSLLILEHLPGKEYTIDCFTDRHGELRFTGARERIRIRTGISVDTQPVDNKKFKKIVEIINRTLHFRGMWFFQMKENAKKQLILMEIAPRVAGAMGLHRNQGVNLPLLTIYDALKQDVKILENKFTLRLDRSLNARYKTNLKYKHVYVDFDDCLVIDGKINTALMSFLYQCVNNKIKIHLLTRTAGNLKMNLKKYRLNSLFDSIISVDKNTLKSKYIKEKSAIFIDDSFRERSEVHKKLKISVFGLESIECLMK